MELDMRGLKCPMPIVKLKLAITSIDMGTEVSVIADDPAFTADIKSWCKMTGNSLLSLDDVDKQKISAVIRKEN